MKMYEKMGIDLSTAEGFKKAAILGCKDIPDAIGREEKKAGCPCVFKDCWDCRIDRLYAEVPTKKRWKTIKNDEELKRMWKEFAERDYGSFLTYLLEEVEDTE